MNYLIRWIQLFKIFFPSWKFFDESKLWPKLEYQINNGSWVIFDNRVRVRPLNLILNSENLILMNFQTHLQRSLMNLSGLSQEEMENYSQTSDYQMTANFLLYYISLLYPNLKRNSLEFRISLGTELIICSENIEVSRP
jgi:hypothetical protein